MPFYETVYETGRMSVAEYADDDEAKLALKAHHDRAINGQPGGPIGQPAERVAAVFIYPKHPDAFNAAQSASADVLKDEVNELINKMKDENGVVSIDLFAMEVRGLSHPMADERKASFDSFYKMKEAKKLNLAFLSEGN